MDRHNNSRIAKPAAGHPERVTITNISPELNGGRYPIKRMWAMKSKSPPTFFADGHEVLSALLLHRTDKQSLWNEVLWSPSRTIGGKAVFAFRLSACTFTRFKPGSTRFGRGAAT